MMASSLLGSQSLTLRHHPCFLSTPKPKTISFTSPYPLFNFPGNKLTISASTTTPIPVPIPTPLTGSTRTLSTLAAFAFAAAKALSHHIIKPSHWAFIAHSAGPAFFAAAKNQPVGLLNTPLTLVAAGLAKWLDIYSGVLMVRVLLSWFPNIPWERQPLSAIRDLCDPYLNLFRNIIPPIFDTLDVSPLLAFAVLGTLGSILNSTRASY